MIEIKKYSINDTNLFIGSCSALGEFNMHTRPLQETQYGENNNSLLHTLQLMRNVAESLIFYLSREF